MMDIERMEYNALLFDFYGELLTAKQKEYFEEHICDDLTISEIAEEKGVSRQAVHDLVKRTEGILADYEKKLQLVDRFLKVKEAVTCINSVAKSGNTDEILRLTEKLLEEL